MSNYYDIRKLKELNVKFLLLNIQRRKHGIIITQKKKDERNKEQRLTKY